MRYRTLFFFFFLSGFCGLLYQVVWLRLAFASFGIITPIISLVISVFMLGLAIGSWFGGKITRAAHARNFSSLYGYAAAEFIIGMGAFIVPVLFAASHSYLSDFGQLNSNLYLLISGMAILCSLLPWSVAMGTTYPLVMGYIEIQDFRDQSGFSFLYLANVVGAMAGAILTALVIIELMGFQKTLFLGASINFLIAAISTFLASKTENCGIYRTTKILKNIESPGDILLNSSIRSRGKAYGILFLTGLTSMAMEVIWTRAFTPVLKTTIYAFALLIAAYLLATWAGSYRYRRELVKKKTRSLPAILIYLALFSLFPLVLNDPCFPTCVLSILPFCGVLGYLTPKIIDEYSLGDPGKAGKIYAVNLAGCIVGPLLAGYILLPFFGVKWSLLLAAAPYLFFVFIFRSGMARHINFVRLFAISTAFIGIFVTRTYEDPFFYEKAQVRRDHTATVISTGEGMQKRLLVNGIGITYMTPITKIMAHLPLAHLQNPPNSALVICFGMGTTFRSLMSWGINVTGVELIPSVKEAFPYYFEDAPEILANPAGRIIIDDGRRYLRRTPEMFDVITLDPPPPVEAAGSSLLYSYNLYEDSKKRLRPGGILHQWFPGGEEKILWAISRSITRAFPHVRVFRSVEGWGYHFLASENPIQIITPEQMLAKIPNAAKKDLTEWHSNKSPLQVVRNILTNEIPLESVLNADRSIEITDDKPFNEYFALRRLWDLL